MAEVEKSHFRTKAEWVLLTVGVVVSTAALAFKMYGGSPDNSVQPKVSTRRPQQQTKTMNAAQHLEGYEIIPQPLAEFKTESEQSKLIAAVEEAANRHPDNAVIHYLAGITFGEILQTAPAIRYLKRSIEIDDQDSKPLLELSEIFLQSGDSEAAISWLEKSLEAGHNSRDVLVRLSDAYSQAGKIEQAAELLLQAEAGSPEDGEVFSKLAQVQNQLGNYEDAEKNARRALELETTDRATYLALSASLMRQKKVDEAKSVRAMLPPITQQVMPDDRRYQDSFKQFSTSTYTRLASICMDLDDSTSAEKYLRDALAILPTHAQAAIALGNLCRLDGRNLDAMRVYQYLTQVQPDNVVNFTNLASLAVSANQVALAEQALRKAVRIDSSGQSDLLLARFLVGVNKTKEAIEHAERAANELASPAAYLTLISTYRMSGDQPAAMNAFIRGKKLFPQDSRFQTYQP